MVTGETGVSRPKLSREFLKGRVKVDFPKADNYEPNVTIAPEVIQVLADVWKSSIIIKLLGKFVPFHIMNDKLRELWQPVGKMMIIDLANNYYVVRFETENDQVKALAGGPWLIYGHYITMKAWGPSFDPEKDTIHSSPALPACLPGLVGFPVPHPA